MTVLRRTVVLAVLCLAAAPTFVQSQSTSEQDLLRRVDSLERRIVELERRIAQLEAAAQSQPAATRAATGSSREIANWRRLRERMTYDQVRSILGEPERVNGGTIAFWFYANAGSVTFMSGRVTDWSEPSP